MKYTKTVSTLLVALMILGFMAPAFATYYDGPGAGTASIFVNPSATTLTKPPYGVGSTFTVHVMIKDYTHVAGWQVKLAYNKTQLSTSTSDVSYAAVNFIFPGGTYPPIPSSVGSIDATYDYALMTTTTYGAVEYSGALAGLMDVTFTILVVPPLDGTLSSMIKIYAPDPPTASGDSWTIDTNLNNNDLETTDGTYSLSYPSPKPYLAMDPTTKTLPAVPGDYIIGQHFLWPIMVHQVVAAKQIILVQYEIHWDPTYIDLVWLWEGSFMNNPTWAPYGTFNNITIPTGPGAATSFILINPNSTTGEWDWGAFPDGDGLLATAEFVVVSQPPEPADPVITVSLPGVFGEYFVDTNANYVTADPSVSGVLTLTGFYWHAPVALFTVTPAAPLPGQIITFDASASFDLDVPWDYIVSYTWNFGDGNITTVAGPVIYHAYATMGLKVVTLTVTDTMGKTGTLTKNVVVVFGRLIDVYTQYPDPDGGQGHNANSSMFWPQKHVQLWVFLSYNGVGVQFKPVAFQIFSPNGVYDFTESNMTDANGYTMIDFGLPWPCADWNDTMGLWHVIAKADVSCVVVQDDLWFKVWWLAEITSVVPKADAYHFCQDAEFDVYFRYYGWMPRHVVITISVFDDLDVCIGTDYVEMDLTQVPVWCTFATDHVTLSCHIPKWTFIGIGTVRANIYYPTWPEFCGTPACPEAVADFVLEAA